MEFRTKVDIPTPRYAIEPNERLLFVGSCFADNIGRHFVEDQFLATVNPYGVMYNPASIMHAVQRWLAEQQSTFFNQYSAASNQLPTASIQYSNSAHEEHNPPVDATICQSHVPDVALFTLGTNHVYVLNDTGEIVDNCQKRPQKLFTERELSIEECCTFLQRSVDMLREANPEIRIIITVSPIRYAKYGYHESQLSKATLLLAADRIVCNNFCCTYFPAYEIVNDELRDYRFYKPDMLHPSEQTVDYIHNLFFENFFSVASKCFVDRWRPIKDALNHRPFDSESAEYKLFIQKTQEKYDALAADYPHVKNIKCSHRGI